MDWIERNVTVAMVREDLNAVPQHRLPEGYHFKWYAPGDDEHWVAVHAAADRYNTIDQALFEREFGRDVARLKERQCFLCTDDQYVGNATAWFDHGFRGQEWGRIHWVGIVPEYQGRGLAKPLMSAVCDRLRELGHTRAYLYTSSARLPAINLYFRFGFDPDVKTHEDMEIWQAIRQRLGTQHG